MTPGYPAEVPDVVGLSEIAERLGMSSGAVRQLHFRGALPKPQFTVSGNPGWSWAVIRGWAEKTGRGSYASGPSTS